MQNITCYYYPNAVEVQWNNDPTLNLRNRIVYTRTVKLYKGVDNVLRFAFKNGDQKTVNVTGWDITFNMLSDDESLIVVAKDAVAVNANLGIVTATITDLDLVDLSNFRYKYSLTITDPYGSEQVVYADDNYGVRGEIELLDGPHPKFKSSIDVLLPSSNTNVTTSSVASDSPSRQQSAHHTTQFYFENFTGNVEVQGTLDTLPAISNIGSATLNWATISTLPFANQADTTYYNFDGVYTAIRYVVTADSGEVSKILYRA